MELITLYLGLAFVGYFVGSKIRNKNYNLKWMSKVQFVAVMLLVFTMGSRIGADEKVISSLDEIGIVAFIITIATLIGSVLMVYIARKLLKIDRVGGKTND